jgi:formylglycine-generating enzyme required for sulfatase activity
VTAVTSRAHVDRGLAWQLIPAGEFLMGSDESDPEASSAEKPQHKICLAQYWMARYPVRNAEWQKFVDAGGYRELAWWNAQGWELRQRHRWEMPRTWGRTAWRGNAPDCPVVAVSWYEALAYCGWLSCREGVPVRLPSEAEWEKAARATDGRRYPFGDALAAGMIHAQGRSESGNDGPACVGSYPHAASLYGVEDLVGNTYAWTSSRWGSREAGPDFKYPYRADDGREEACSNDLRIVRGGAWRFPVANARCAYRGKDHPADAFENLGVRLASSSVA